MASETALVELEAFRVPQSASDQPLAHQMHYQVAVKPNPREEVAWNDHFKSLRAIFNSLPRWTRRFVTVPAIWNFIFRASQDVMWWWRRRYIIIAKAAHTTSASIFAFPARRFQSIVNRLMIWRLRLEMHSMQPAVALRIISASSGAM